MMMKDIWIDNIPILDNNIQSPFDPFGSYIWIIYETDKGDIILDSLHQFIYEGIIWSPEIMIKGKIDPYIFNSIIEDLGIYGDIE